ncbi:HypA [Arthroderma uncinatum]|uniref:HypA n=1 Tax=Arthroderma uncinatum TaxID=74035 RepID=UPI00144A75CF|nr:HypA [Arthroderma uncinatum]KAF3479537.1 HypA [Arthroderma uncinatum]
MIHLGFGIEFNQPAIVAQALAQTATHDNKLQAYFQPVERMANDAGKSGKTLVQLQDELRNDPDIKGSVLWADTNKIFDGVMYRAPEKMIKYASQFTVGPDEIEEKLAELINATVYYTGAAQNPRKVIKFDFFYIHALNSNIFLPAFLSQPWMTKEKKIRLLEWKARMDLLVYVSRNCVEPRLEDITNYVPKMKWDEIFKTTVGLEQDDGHAAKFVRHVAHAEKLCKPYEGKDGFRIKGDMWLKLGNMLVDSVSGPGSNWVRSAGFEEAWKDVPDRK